MGTCRACLRVMDVESARSLDDLHDESELLYAELLERCVGLSVRCDCGGACPRALCATCRGSLAAAWSFALMCRESDARLHSVAVPSVHRYFKSETEVLIDYNAKSEDHKSDKSEPVSEGEEFLANTVRQRSGPRRARATAGEPATCAACGHVALTECRYKKHVKSCHPELLHDLVAYPCLDCSRVFKRKSDLRVHARVHSGEKPFACERCPLRFAQSGTLAEHRRHHTGETPYRCDICRRAFSSRSSFWRHSRVHTRERPYTCATCGRVFAHAATLRTHALVHSDARPHVCRVCGKAAKSPCGLRRHARVHSEREFVCEHCGKAFTAKSNLELHTRKMHGARAGRCVVCARDASDLPRHMLRHATAPAFVCDVCSRSFRLRSALVFHLGFHNDADKYKCTSAGCGAAFPKLNMLRFHTLKRHSEETPHVCAHCCKGFFRTSDLTRHVNTSHPTVAAPAATAPLAHARTGSSTHCNETSLPID